MAKFSTKERMIASMLSSMPIIKSFLKKAYIRVNYILNKKNYRFRIIDPEIKDFICIVEPDSLDAETFFGYYDKSPESADGKILFHQSLIKTSHKPSGINPIAINIMDVHTGRMTEGPCTLTYNWQQGSRSQWIDHDSFIYNIFENNSYKSAVFNTRTSSIIKKYDYPVQDAYRKDYFLAIDYRRIMKLRPDYGYRNLPLESDDETRSLDNTGIWKIEFNTGKAALLLSLREICSIAPSDDFLHSTHKVNHVMISPNGKRFIFIHRWYRGRQRFDRLMLYDFKSLKVIANERMVSHLCWVDDSTVFGYLTHNGQSGFYFIDVDTFSFQGCDPLNELGYGDGHPSCFRNWIVVDTYPDKSRMQHLFLYNTHTHSISHLLEVYQDVSFYGESRCDLHPRFSPDGGRIYFDTVYADRRRLAYISVKHIIGPA